MDIGILLLRLAVGLTAAAHGSQKLFGAFGGQGPGGTADFFDQLGLRPGRTFALVAGLGEFVGGLLLVFGLLTPFGAALIIATMCVAIFTVHVEKGFFNQAGGYEHPLLLAAGAAAVAFTGPGRVSLDAAMRTHMAGSPWGLFAVALGAAAGAAIVAGRELARRRPHGPTTRQG